MMALFDDEKIRDAFGYEKEMKGRREGRREGLLEERARIIRVLRESNMADEAIARTLELSIDDVEAVPVKQACPTARV